MEAFQFQTNVKNGIIEIPSEYRQKLKGLVKVTIFASPAKRPGGIIAHLLENPIRDPSFIPLSRDEIYENRG